MDKMFELVDGTADEYYTLGLFETMDDALAAATQGDQPPTECEEYARLEVRERRTGFTGWGYNGRVVAEIVWSEHLDEVADEWRWNKPVVTMKGGSDE